LIIDSDFATLVVDPGIFQGGLFHHEVWFSKEGVPLLFLVFKEGVHSQNAFSTLSCLAKSSNERGGGGSDPPSGSANYIIYYFVIPIGFL
jgi:hypothetical protein